MSYSNHGNPQGMAQQYLKQKIEQAGPVEQVLMLYDGAMKFMLQAKGAIERGDVEARCNANRRAMEIVAYLVDMVNPETGGEAGKRLFGIYSTMLRRMLQIDFTNDPTICDEVVSHFRSLRTAMAEALAVQQGGPAAGTVVAAPAADAPAGTVRRNAVA
jgi:flagellar secretion chaperone FliS